MAKKEEAKKKVVIKEKAVEKKAKAITLVAKKMYNFKANKDAPYMVGGKVYPVTGALGEILVNKSYGKIVD
jgi:ribosomal protein L35AE/L33A